MIDSQAIVQFLPIVLIFVVMYLFLIRPQQKKAQDHKKMLAALRRGDRVVTGGGVIGTVAKVVNDEEVLVDIAEGARVRVVRSTIGSVLAKSEPAKDKDRAEAAPEANDGGAAEGRDKRRNAARSGSK
jgi:preprotein translocase subunit YajC